MFEFCDEDRLAQHSHLTSGEPFPEDTGRARRRFVRVLSAGIEIAHHDTQHLSGQLAFALGDVHIGAKLAGLIGRGRLASQQADGRSRRDIVHA